MSPPPVPPFARSVAAVFRLHTTRVLRGKKLRLGLAALILVVLGALISRYAADGVNPERMVRRTIDVGFFGFLAYLLPFLFHAGAIAEEVEGRTFTYVAARPTGRVALTFGKWLSGCAFAGALLVAGVFVLHLGAFATTPEPMVEALDDTARAAGALLLLGTYYGAVCLFWGALLPEAAGILSLLYLVVLEFAPSFMPSMARLVSMNYHAEQLAGLERGGFMPESVPEVGAPWSVAAIVVLTLVFTGLAALVVRLHEYRFSKA